MRVIQVNGAAQPVADEGPELQDVRRFGQMLVRRFVAKARADDRPTVRSIVTGHLDRSVDDLPVTEETWPGYEHVNVQRALDTWLEGPNREHRIVGLTDYRHRGQFGLGDLLVDSMHAMHGPRPGAITRVGRASGPAGATQECLRAALVLVKEGEDRFVALFRGPDHDMDNNGVRVEVVSTDDEVVRRFTAALRDLVVEQNVYRGHVVSFGNDMFGERGSLLRFHERPKVTDAELIAEQRDHYSGQTPMLFTLLNEMDGLAEDADVVFLLTTNRADLLEPALAARPGRVDQAVHVRLPDTAGRRRLLELYRGGLDLDTSRVHDVLSRTDGVTASFLKELLRRAAVIAADGSPDGESALQVSADDLDRALAELLDTRNQMTRAVLGFRDGEDGEP